LGFAVLATCAALIVILLLRAAAAWLERGPADSHLDHYRDADRALIASGHRPDVVLIGDSITERWPTYGSSSWPTNWLNRGIGGERSDQVRDRFDQDAVQLHPRAVVILVGTNDAWVNRPDLPLVRTESNIAAMAKHASDHGIHVVIAAVPPVGKKVTAPGLPMPTGANPRIVEQNAWARTYAARRGYSFADYWGVMRPDLTSDGVHPSAAGYAVMLPVATHAIATAR
jgi:lysophospholipase L1-like esterase